MTRYHATSEGNIPFTAEEEAEWDVKDTAWEAGAFDRTKDELQSKNKDACKSHILSIYPIEIQASMNAGVYSALAFEAYQTFLAACINEENRVFDLLEAATTIDELTLVPEPIYPEV